MILKQPDEDSHLLVYADWLDENGRSERAEFIRVQIALATTTTGCDKPSWYELRNREQELIRSHDLDLPQIYGAGEWNFFRGFLTEIRISRQEFSRHAKYLFSHHPITRVMLLDNDVATHNDRLGNTYYMIREHMAFHIRYWDRLLYHPNSQSALNAASDVCVEVGRELAGLSQDILF